MHLKRRCRWFFAVALAALSVILVPVSARAASSEPVFLSDLEPVSATVGQGTLGRDVSFDKGALCLQVDGAPRTFAKGLSTHADAEVVYDIEGKGYERLQSWLGINYACRDKQGNGVAFSVYRRDAKDGPWQGIYNADKTIVQGLKDNAVHVSLDVSGAVQVKLEVSTLGHDWNDQAEWDGAKFTDATYDDTATPAPVPSIEPLDSLDKKIADKGADHWKNLDALAADDEMLLLRRTFIERFGYDALQSYAGTTQDRRDLLAWLMDDFEMMRNMVLGGAPDGSPMKALDVLRSVAGAFPQDFKQGAADGPVFRRMLASLALTHCKPVRYWTGDAPASDPRARYYTLKTLREHASEYHFRTDIFDWLPVEDMRWVADNMNSDAGMAWLVNYSLKRFGSNEGHRLDAYMYIYYDMGWENDGGYNWEPLYEQNNFDGAVTGIDGAVAEHGWQGKYGIFYDDDPHFPASKDGDYFRIPYGAKGQHYPWMVFEKRGVCGSLSKTYSNLYAISGIPSAVNGQPAHAACFAMTELRRDPATGKPGGVWSIANDISGWWETEKGERYPCGWGSAKTQSSDIYNGSYLLLSQAALNDMNAYGRSLYLQTASAAFSGADAEALVDAALAAQLLNLDAWELKLAQMQSAHATDGDLWVKVAQGAAEALKWHPKPMNDLLLRIAAMAPADTSVQTLVGEARVGALQAALTCTDSDTIQPEVCVNIAQHLLGKADNAVFSFSLSGENANTIKLGPQFQTINWYYSLDGGTTWTNVSGSKERLLTAEEVAKLNERDGIRVVLTGSTTQHALALTKPATPDRVWFNDETGRIFTDCGAPCEVRLEGEAAWRDLSSAEAFNAGDKVEVRRRAQGTELASDPVSHTFAARGATPDDSFVPLDDYSVYGASSEEDPRVSKEKVHDGDPYTFWYTKHDRSDTDKYLVLDLGAERTLTKVRLTPRQTTAVWGNPDKVRFYVTGAAADGTPDENGWTEVAEQTFGASDPLHNDQAQDVALKAGARGRFFKMCEVSQNAWLALAEIELFENAYDLAQAPMLALGAGSVRTFDGAPASAADLGLVARRGGADASSHVRWLHRDAARASGPWFDGTPVSAGEYVVRAELPEAREGAQLFGAAAAEGRLTVRPRPVDVAIEGAQRQTAGAVTALVASFEDVGGVRRAATVAYDGKVLDAAALTALAPGTYVLSASIDCPDYEVAQVTGPTKLVVEPVGAAVPPTPAPSPAPPAERPTPSDPATPSPDVPGVPERPEAPEPSDDAPVHEGGDDGAERPAPGASGEDAPVGTSVALVNGEAPAVLAHGATDGAYVIPAHYDGEGRPREAKADGEAAPESVAEGGSGAVPRAALADDDGPLADGKTAAGSAPEADSVNGVVWLGAVALALGVPGIACLLERRRS